MPDSGPELVVMTGDIVGSSRLTVEELDAAIEALRLASDRVQSAWGGGASRFSRYRGDSWQCLGPAAGHALRATLLMRAWLRRLGPKHDTRVSIGIGPGVLSTGSGLAGASGAAFEVSGRGLDDMPHAARFAVAWADPPAAAELVQSVFALSDEISRRWTARQAEIFMLALGPPERPSQDGMAEMLGIRQQVVARHLAAGGDWALRQALAALERPP